MAKITIDGVTGEYPDGMTYEEIADAYQDRYENTIALVLEDGKIRELIKTVHKDCTLSFLTLKDSIGHKAYVRTAVMVLLRAAADVIPEANIKVEFAIGPGYYCDVRMGKKLTEDMVKQIRARMQELVDEKIPITKKTYSIDEAREIFKKQKMEDKGKLFRYKRSSFANVYCLDGYYDYYYGFMLPDTGYVKYFDLMLYEKGLLLLLPGMDAPCMLEVFGPREKLFRTLRTASHWGEMMNIDSVGDLNDTICAGEMIAGLCFKYFTFQTYDISDVHFFESFVFFLTDAVSCHIRLDIALQILDIAERCFSHYSLGHHTSCEHYTLSFQILKLIFDFLAVMCHIKFCDLKRVFSVCLQFCKLIAADFQQLIYVLCLLILLFSHCCHSLIRSVDAQYFIMDFSCLSLYSYFIAYFMSQQCMTYR